MNLHFRKVRLLLSYSTLLLLIGVFACEPDPEATPSLSISKLTQVSAVSISVQVQVKSLGAKDVPEHGFVWSEHPNPTINDNKYIFDKMIFDVKTYTDTATNLKPNTTYYFKAYVINKNNSVYYSEEASLGTPLHEIFSFAPASGQPDMKITILGGHFEQGLTSVYFNELKAEINVLASSVVEATIPFGLLVDSATISVEMGGRKIAFVKKIQYKKGRWVKLKSIMDNSNDPFTYLNGLSIQGKGYVIGSRNEIYRYTPENNTWTELTTFEASASSWKKWFAVVDQLFITEQFSSDFWMYSISANQWSKATPFPISSWSASSGLSFSFGNSGYMGLAVKNGQFTKEIWKFNLSNSSWTRLNDFPSTSSVAWKTLSLVTDNEVYIIGGTYHGTTNDYSKEMWKYQPLTDSWERKANYPGQGGVNLTGFVMNSKLYVGTGLIEGLSPKTVFRDFWEYNPATDKWTPVADFVNNRYYAYSFSINNVGYVGGGFSPDPSCTQCGERTYTDLWKFELQ